MFIVPMSPSISPLASVEQAFSSKMLPKVEDEDTLQPNFLDVFSGIAKNASETSKVKSQDMIDLMNGNVDNIEQVQANIAKAEIALDLLINVKNTAVDAYNEIVKMSI